MALLGGLIIGVAVSWMLLFHGRVTGISGIFAGALQKRESWRWFFLLGLIAGGFSLRFYAPEAISSPRAGFWRLAVAGLLVGFGTAMASGCTSGHGVCGMSRLSPRSIVATIVFIATGVLTVGFLRWLGLPV